MKDNIQNEDIAQPYDRGGSSGGRAQEVSAPASVTG